MSHFDVSRFYDKNSERFMFSKRIKQLMSAVRSDFFVIDSESTGDFFFRDGQYYFDDREKGEWTPFAANKDYWGYPECYAWFKQTVKIPERFKGCHVIYRVAPFSHDEWDSVNPQLIVYINGKQVQGMDSNHQYISISDCALGGETLEIYINAHTDAKEFKGEVQMGAVLQTIDDDAIRVYYDIMTPLEVANNYDCDDIQRVNNIKLLNEACNMLDIDSGDRESFRKSAAKASAFLNENLYGKADEPTAWCIGHTHIDVAWLWRLRQTREKASRTFSTMLKYMDMYPDFKFMSSQAQLYDFVKQDYPELYSRIKEKIKSGQWEAEGSMWLEADTNIASGESLVRQFLVGKRFFKKEFGVDNKIMWLPDVFGYSAAIPQIIKKCGCEYFMTTKISWSEYNKFPYDTFMWRGIDGTEVLSHFSPSSDRQSDPAENFITTYNAYLCPNHIIGGYDRFSQKDISKNYLCTFGYGDGGGGPTIDMIEQGKRMEKGIEGCPSVKISPAIDFFRHIDKEVSGEKHLPTWCGELYLEYHRGTLTSQARNKKYNRKSECLYSDVELLSGMAMKKTCFSYPSERLLENWKTILLNQFHDILPGSSIKAVYDDSKLQYEEVLKNGCEMASEAEAAIVSKIDLESDSIVLFNTTGFLRKDAVVTEAPSDGEFSLYDVDGSEIAYQKTYDGKIVFVTEIPAKGYKAVSVKYEKGKDFKEISADSTHAETKYFDVEFNGEYNISKLLHKKSGRNAAPEGETLGKLTAYQDRPHHYEAWDVKCYYKELSWDFDFIGAELIEKGAVRCVYKVDRRFRNSVISEYYIIYSELERIDIEYKTDWKEKNAIVKADYPVDVNATRATFDIQFGNIERATTENTTWDFAQFEVSMHKWVDLSDNSFGLSVLNDCKYGCSVKDGHIRPTLLRCATKPNQDQDREYHEFTFSLYPHSGTVASSDVYNEAYSLNYPVYAVYSNAHKGVLKSEYSFVSTDKSNIIIDTVKKAEDSDSIIIRAFESKNAKTRCTIKTGDALKGVFECNMLEEADVPVNFCGDSFETEFKPFEIKTFKLDF